MRSLILLGLMVATPAAAADQFDLVCSAKKVSERYRVDLTSGEYCTAECKTVRKIQEVTTGVIVFQRTEPKVRRDPRILDQVNRTTGEWFSSNYFPGIDLVPDMKQGTCQSAPFSGFPASKF